MTIRLKPTKKERIEHNVDNFDEWFRKQKNSDLLEKYLNGGENGKQEGQQDGEK